MAPTIPVFTVDLTGELLGRGVHGLLEHDWLRDGWVAFTPVTISADPGQVFATTTTAAGTGVVTGTESGHGNHRVAYLRSGTEWADAEVTSLVLPPGGWGGTNAQQGHLHRVREVSPGLWEGIAVWTAIVGGDYALLNCRAVRWDGSVLIQAPTGDPADASDAGEVDRTVQVVSRQRFSFLGSWINEYRCVPTHLNGLRVGDVVTVAGVDLTSFNLTDVPVANADRGNGVLQVVSPTVTGAVAWATTPTGSVRGSGVDAEKRWAPFWFSTRVVGGTGSAVTVLIKRWRPQDGEPDWSSPVVQRHTVIPGGSVPSVALGPGACALWTAHFNGGSSGSWGGVRFRRLTVP